jgi:hypothetical protein
MNWFITLTVVITFAIGFLCGVVHTQSKVEKIYYEELEDKFNNPESDLK